MNETGEQPSICLILSICVESQPLQRFRSGAHIQRPLEGALAAVHHLVDLLKAIGKLPMQSKTEDRKNFRSVVCGLLLQPIYVLMLTFLAKMSKGRL